MEDSNPERRNLVGTSLAFIAYFYGGGTFVDSAVTLHVISVKFVHTSFLAFMAWSMLIWFLYRYWLLHSGSFTKGFIEEIYELKKSQKVSAFLEHETGLAFLLNQAPADDEAGYIVHGVWWKGWCLRATYAYGTAVMRNAHSNEITSYRFSEPTPTTPIEHKFTSFRGWASAIYLTFGVLVKRRSFSDYLVPYLLFLIALLGALYDALSK